MTFFIWTCTFLLKMDSVSRNTTSTYSLFRIMYLSDLKITSFKNIILNSLHVCLDIHLKITKNILCTGNLLYSTELRTLIIYAYKIKLK